MRYKNIPPELRGLRRWVCADNGSKVPMVAGCCNYCASCSASGSWSSFEESTESVSRGEHDHIGFVFADDGIVGIDIDAGYNDDGFLSELAIDIIGRCRSYTEKSRSGRGFHILLRGDIPFKGKNNRNGVEIYKTGRYFIMTGDTLLYDKIVENQEAIDYIISKYFPEIRESAPNKRGLWKAYNPIWERSTEGKIKLRPKYPAIPDGCRNLSLASLAGAMHNQGYSPKHIYNELLHCNEVACDPPLSQREVEGIVSSITRYRRKPNEI